MLFISMHCIVLKMGIIFNTILTSLFLRQATLEMANSPVQNMKLAV